MAFEDPPKLLLAEIPKAPRPLLGRGPPEVPKLWPEGVEARRAARGLAALPDEVRQGLAPPEGAFRLQRAASSAAFAAAPSRVSLAASPRSAPARRTSADLRKRR